jgi:hypothetical protein
MEAYPENELSPVSLDDIEMAAVEQVKSHSSIVFEEEEECG